MTISLGKTYINKTTHNKRYRFSFINKMKTINQNLIVLDLNGLFIERKHKSKCNNVYNHQFETHNGYYVFVRPYTKEFLRYVFSSFYIGIWSCMNKKNTQLVIKRLFTKSQQKQLMFVLNQEDCYKFDEFKRDNTPVFYKHLNNLWEEYRLFQFFNFTLLIDSSKKINRYSYEYTTIHPTSFNSNYKNDKELKHLRKYLEELSFLEVPVFVKNNPYHLYRKHSTTDYEATIDAEESKSKQLALQPNEKTDTENTLSSHIHNDVKDRMYCIFNLYKNAILSISLIGSLTLFIKLNIAFF